MTDRNEQRDQTLAGIAKRTLSIPTLTARGSDSLDFHNVAVGSLLEALRLAFAAGYERAVTDSEPAAEPEAILKPDGCPNCGERHPDRLIWSEEGDSIACHSCGTTYSIQSDS